ncbi:hypothetical protein GCM10010211_71990 [Streptomyces albospinus]|uniref:Uncharacterized protein n=1 Tax=Streptomyces albospinus TaxID=285515 RepID=A0ABQ2VLN2_9ACTN|nr:hypothetical protein GCM10010211_71990 [Streptomyces albospinus]
MSTARGRDHTFTDSEPACLTCVSTLWSVDPVLLRIPSGVPVIVLAQLGVQVAVITGELSRGFPFIRSPAGRSGTHLWSDPSAAHEFVLWPLDTMTTG